MNKILSILGIQPFRIWRLLLTFFFGLPFACSLCLIPVALIADVEPQQTEVASNTTETFSEVETSLANTPELTKTPEPTATTEPTNTPQPTATTEPTNIPGPTATTEPTNTPRPTMDWTSTETPTASYSRTLEESREFFFNYTDGEVSFMSFDPESVFLGFSEGVSLDSFSVPIALGTLQDTGGSWESVTFQFIDSEDNGTYYIIPVDVIRGLSDRDRLNPRTWIEEYEADI